MYLHGITLCHNLQVEASLIKSQAGFSDKMSMKKRLRFVAYFSLELTHWVFAWSKTQLGTQKPPLLNKLQEPKSSCPYLITTDKPIVKEPWLGHEEKMR